jgi:hypothetical protein
MNAEHRTPNTDRASSFVRAHFEVRGSGFGVRCLAASLFAATALAAEPTLPNAKPIPRMQAIPQPHAQVSFQREGVEVVRYHSGDDGNRPFLFPVLGPSGRSLTRMGHPRDPQGHSHHHSVWISHHSVDGVDFWGDRSGARIVHLRTVRLDDSDAAAFLETENAWRDQDGKTLLTELRRTTVRDLPGGERLLTLELQLEARGGAVTLGESPFGLCAVRMAKTIGVHDGGGTIRNSEGGVDEAGCFRRPARWCDYSGPIAPGAVEGITLMDHPMNPHHPIPFHVRDDGWMGASLTFPGAITIQPGSPLRLRYGLWVHAGLPSADAIDKRWQEFARERFTDFVLKR